MYPAHSTKRVGRNILIATGAIVVTFGVGVSFFFAREIESFFWQARTKSVLQEVTEVGAHTLKENYIARWTEADPGSHIQEFSEAIKREIPSVVAVRVFNLDGTIVWSDLNDKAAGEIEPDLDELGPILLKESIAIEEAGYSAKELTGRENLLEIYSVVIDSRGEIVGFVECYFDSSDITAFIQKTNAVIIGSIIIGVTMIVSLLRLALRKQDDIIIRQSYELSNLVDQSPVGIYTINQKGNILSVNPMMLSFLEEAPENILGNAVWDVKKITQMEIDKPTHEALQGKPFDKEVRVLGRNNTETYYRYRGTPIMSANNKVVEQVFFIVEDITKNKMIERTAVERTKELEEGVMERTKELKSKINELEQFEKLTIGREIRMTELKQEMEEMQRKIKELEVRNAH